MRSASAPARSACFESSTASEVRQWCVPATTGSRPALASITASSTARRSPESSAANSPELPSGERAWAPSAMIQSMCGPMRGRSGRPSAVNGVTVDAHTPRNKGLAIVSASRTGISQPIHTRADPRAGGQPKSLSTCRRTGACGESSAGCHRPQLWCPVVVAGTYFPASGGGGHF